MNMSRLIAALIVCTTAALPSVTHARTCPLPGNMDELRAQLVADVNAERTARGLPA